MESAQDILRFFPSVNIWVALTALPAVGIIRQIRAALGVVFCRENLELHTRNVFSGVFPSSSISRLLYLWKYVLKEKGHSMVLNAYGHNIVE